LLERRRWVIHVLEAEEMAVIRAAARSCGVGVRESYGGRWMYGETCLGLCASSVRDAVRTLVMLSLEDARLAHGLAGAWTQDAMGLGVIIYFPEFTPAPAA
jgi:hypothetical protein